jgi:hypothetical protein
MLIVSRPAVHPFEIYFGSKQLTWVVVVVVITEGGVSRKYLLKQLYFVNMLKLNIL